MAGKKLLAVIAPVWKVSDRTDDCDRTRRQKGFGLLQLIYALTDDKNMCDEHLTQSCICTDKNNMAEDMSEKRGFSAFRRRWEDEIIPAMPKSRMDSVYAENEIPIRKVELTAETFALSADKSSGQGTLEALS